MSETKAGPEFLQPSDERLAERLSRDGVVFVADLLTAEQVAETRREIERYEQEVLPTVPGEEFTYDGEGKIRSMEYMQVYDPWFKAFGEGTAMAPVTAAVSWEPMLYDVAAWVKPAQGPATLPHQELYTSPVDPPEYVHIWIALEDITSENGSLTFYRGTHRFGLAPHVVSDDRGTRYVDSEVMSKLQKVRVQPDYPAGSAALFDCLMVHESPPNMTSSARPALALGYRGARTTVPSEEDRLTSRLTEMFANAMPGSGLQEGDDLFDGGADDALAEQLSSTYGVSLSREDLIAAPSPRLLARHILKVRGEEA